MSMFLVAPAAGPPSSNYNNETIISAPPDHHRVGLFPLLTVDPASASAVAAGYQFWQTSNDDETTMIKKTASAVLDHSGATATCQDCGNQAKKDCNHRRCRSCCKSRNLDCATHVKSTWVPASRRRERQQLMPCATATSGASGSSSVVKKPRVINSQNTATSHTSNSNNTPPRSFDTASTHQDASFKEGLPEQVRAPAVFKCVRMTALEDGEDEYAYQGIVKINGHVFKGLLYNQGVQSKDGYPNISDLHLSGATSSGGGGGRNGGSSAAQNMAPTDVYGTSGGGMVGGSSYGNPIN